MSNNLVRILTAIVAAPIVLVLAYVGGWPFAVLVAAVGVVGQAELYRLARSSGARPNVTAGLVMGVLVVVVLARPSFWPMATLWLIAFLILAPFLLQQSHFLTSLTVTIAGAVYPTGLLGSLVLLRDARVSGAGDEVGFWLVLFTFFLVWATDIFAYYVGKGIGSHSLAPTMSPNKTWEGTMGGLAAAVLVAIGMKVTVLGFIEWSHVLVLSVLGGGIGQIGDLLESQLKRSTDADDSGSILPGHGGMLDRFDAMTVAAPLIYLYLYGVVGIV